MNQEERCIFIVGPNRLQNEMMAPFIESRMEVKCRVESELSNVPPGGRGGQTLTLFDCRGRGAEALFSELRSENNRLATSNLLALFNVMEAVEIEKEALVLGVRGFFYDHDGPETLLKGIGALFDDQLWLSRRKFSEVLERGLGMPSGKKKTLGGLTAREAEILNALALGIPNETIAKKLCISPHTVKTHIYHIFRKIDVQNRIQAARWAMNNLF